MLSYEELLGNYSSLLNFMVNQNFKSFLNKSPVGVFWDIENCSIPRGINTYMLVNEIRSIYSIYNLLEGEFDVVGDIYAINNNVVIKQLNDMQVNLLHVCSYSKNASDEKLKQLILRFIMNHGSASVIILISSIVFFLSKCFN